MGSFLAILALLIVGAVLLIAIASWVSTKRYLFRNVVAFCLSGGSSYSFGFLFNMWVLAATGAIIPPSNVIWPSFTWLSVAVTCVVAALLAAASPYALALPFLINAAIALAFAPSEHEVIFIALPLVVVGGAILLFRRRELLRGPKVTVPTAPDSFDSQPSSDAEIEHSAALAVKFAWIGVANNLGALITVAWLLYLVFTTKGFLVALLVFLFLGVAVYPFGMAPMFAVAASAVNFYFDAVGAWLPIASYVTAAVALYIDLRVDRVRRKLFPF